MFVLNPSCLFLTAQQYPVSSSPCFSPWTPMYINTQCDKKQCIVVICPLIIQGMIVTCRGNSTVITGDYPITNPNMVNNFSSIMCDGKHRIIQFPLWWVIVGVTLVLRLKLCEQCCVICSRETVSEIHSITVEWDIQHYSRVRYTTLQ